ncbi:MAG: imidazolonepropionase [Acidobacteria bacterium]|nr:imidazolonepropionase [Acidobacteriota bacterium]MYF13412.1 imidazolonepropionase [Acidobacteriota bacterium]MYI97839.1 imidazolonepropionase [Acidobacteriota bacterium]
MGRWDLLLTDAHIATMRGGAPDPYGAIEDGALAIRDGEIAWVGPRSDLPAHATTEVRSLEGRWITPALIDCHTHLVFAGDRGSEFEARLGGATYEGLAAAGGGIMATVRATRAASAEELFRSARGRLEAMARAGAATVEIKSGYGLDRDTEIRMLEVARRLGRASGLTVRATLLAAHAVPPEFGGRPVEYLGFVADVLLPEVARRGLADAVDAYCEEVAFSAVQIAPLFERVCELGLPVKLHADQLTDGGGAALAARFGALSADHLEYTPESGIEALASAGTVAVLLPGAFLTLGETRRPRVEALRRHGVPIAVATDCNPGTSPLGSLTEAMGLAARLFGLTPEECLAGVTRHAARALGLEHDRGTLEPGKRADIAVWDIGHPRDLTYWLGRRALAGLLVAGRDRS